jgi:Methyltransferase FkbM domain
MRNLEKKIKTWLRNKDIYFGKKTSIQQLNDFFKNIRPITTEHKLIRLGEKSDGGYLIPNDLDGITACFSPGVSAEAHLEEELARRQVRSFMADYSVDSSPIQNSLFDFEKKYIGLRPSETHMTLEDWVNRKVSATDIDLILQMDIEGEEYDVIFDTSNETLRRFRIIVIEFHKLDILLDKYGYQIINTAFNKLLKNFSIVHIHPNNTVAPIQYRGYEFPPFMEFTFLRKDRFQKWSYTESFPHPLDSVNVRSKPDFQLPQCWYKPVKT